MSPPPPPSSLPPGLWRLDPLDLPREGHAADAVEIVGGEIVRRVSLSLADYRVLQAYQQAEKAAPDGASQPDTPPSAVTLSPCVGLTLVETEAALNRLAVAGLLPSAPTPNLQ